MFNNQIIAPTEEELKLAYERMEREQAKRREIQAERDRIMHEREAKNEAEEAAEREAREQPISRVVDLLADRFGADLPAFARELMRVDLARVKAFLQRTIAADDKATREAEIDDADARAMAETAANAVARQQAIEAGIAREAGLIRP